MKKIFLYFGYGVLAIAFWAGPILGSQSSSFIVFMHALRGNADRWHVRACYEDLFLSQLPVYAANGPDHLAEEVSESISLDGIAAMKGSSKWYHRLRREIILLNALRRASLGQENDVERVSHLLCTSNLSSEEGICFGHSKGAALTAILLSEKEFKGAILVAPFYHGNLAFRDFPPFSLLSRSSRFCNIFVVPLFRYFLIPKYRRKGPQPCNLAQSQHNRDTPILIISVKDDRSVPQYHQYALYIGLKQAGFSRVYFYEIEGDHGDMLAHDPEKHAELVKAVQGFQRDIIYNRFSEINSPSVVEIERRMKEKFNLTMDDVEQSICMSDWSNSIIPGVARLAAIGSLAWGVCMKVFNAIAAV